MQCTYLAVGHNGEEDEEAEDCLHPVPAQMRWRLDRQHLIRVGAVICVVALLVVAL